MERLYTSTIELEIVGRTISPKKVARIPIHKEPLPQIFKYDMTKPKCFYYEYSSYAVQLRQLSGFGTPGTKTQITNIEAPLVKI